MTTFCGPKPPNLVYNWITNTDHYPNTCMFTNQVIDGELSNPIFGYQPFRFFLCLQNMHVWKPCHQWCVKQPHIWLSANQHVPCIENICSDYHQEATLNEAMIFHCSFPIQSTYKCNLCICQFYAQSVYCFSNLIDWSKYSFNNYRKPMNLTGLSPVRSTVII